VPSNDGYVGSCIGNQDLFIKHVGRLREGDESARECAARLEASYSIEVMIRSWILLVLGFVLTLLVLHYFTMYLITCLFLSCYSFVLISFHFMMFFYT
jgi:hypothetical protein